MKPLWMMSSTSSRYYIVPLPTTTDAQTKDIISAITIITQHPEIDVKHSVEFSKQHQIPYQLNVSSASIRKFFLEFKSLVTILAYSQKLAEHLQILSPKGSLLLYGNEFLTDAAIKERLNNLPDYLFNLVFNKKTKIHAPNGQLYEITPSGFIFNNNLVTLWVQGVVNADPNSNIFLLQAAETILAHIEHRL